MAQTLDLDVREGLRLAGEALPLAFSAESQAACLDFIVGRLRSYLMEREENFRYDIVAAVLAEQAFNPAGALRAIRALSTWVQREDWNTVLPACARCVRITRDQKENFPVVPAAFEDPAEKALYEALLAAERAPRRPGSVEDLFAIFLPLIPLINRFFEAVLVMANDPVVRTNRLGLLQRVAALPKGVGDFSKLEGF